MRDLIAFLETQGRIYERFETDRKSALQEGLTIDPVLSEQRAGYAITFALLPGLVEAISEFVTAARISVPGIAFYDPEVLHTTVSDLHTEPGSLPGIDTEVAQSLGNLVREISGSLPPARCYYGSYIFNGSSIILTGYPDQGFLDAAEILVAAAEACGISLRMPWGGHVTIGRVCQPVSSEVVRDLDALCLRASTPQGLHEFGAMQLSRFCGRPDRFVRELVS